MQKRVIRIIEYSGDPEWIDKTLASSIQAELRCDKGRISSHIIKEELFAPQTAGYFQEEQENGGGVNC